MTQKFLEHFMKINAKKKKKKKNQTEFRTEKLIKKKGD